MSNMMIKNQRSISLPSRSNPTTTEVKEVVNNVIKTIKTTTDSSESILMSLTSLEELYNHTEEFLKMGSTIRVISSNGSEFMEEMLDGSLKLMDICNVSRDLMVETHEHVLEVHSYVRRKKVIRRENLLRSTDFQLQDLAVSRYVGFRKNMRKEAKKLLKSLKKLDGGLVNYKDQEDEVIELMREVVTVSVLVLKSFLMFLSGRESNIKTKLASVLKKKNDCYEETKNELEGLDFAMCCSNDDLEKKLEEVEMSIDGFEKILEGLFRRLIRTRASLLNIISL